MVRAIQEGRLTPSVLQEAKAGAEDGDEALSTRKKPAGGKKNRGPVNLDRQCGVINNKGLPCSRSLTCKSHSMGAKRNVPGRSQPYDTLLFEWQKATNPAFVARLEEKERAIAAAKAAASASKERKRKGAAGERRTDAAGDRDLTSTRAERDAVADMYSTGATYQEVDRELFSALHTIHMSAVRDRTTILPLATRSFAGQYTSRAKRFRVLRQFLAQGLSGTAHVRAARLGEDSVQ